MFSEAAPVSNSDEAHPTRTERSARAAEEQAKLQRDRVFIGFVAMLVAILAFLFGVRPWRTWSAPEPLSEIVQDDEAEGSR